MKTPAEYYIIGKQEMDKADGGGPYGSIEPSILGLIQAMGDFLKELEQIKGSDYLVYEGLDENT